MPGFLDDLKKFTDDMGIEESPEEKQAEEIRNEVDKFVGIYVPEHRRETAKRHMVEIIENVLQGVLKRTRELEEEKERDGEE